MMLSFFFFFRFWISILVLGSLWLFLPSSSKSMRLVVFDESDSSSFHQGLGFHKEIGFPRKNRFLKSQRPTLRYDASSLPQDGSASSTFDIHSKNPVLDLVESSSNESASACVESFLKLVQAIASSEDERFLSRIILCSNETIVFDHAIDISNKCLQIQCQLSTSPSLCVLKGSSKSGLFQAIDSSHHSMSFQGVTFCGGSSEFGSVVQVIVSSRDSASDPRMKNCYASSPPFAANPKLDFLECTFQDNVASSAGGALYLRGPGGSSRLTGCVFRNNTATHAGGAIYASDGYHVKIDRTILKENRATNVCGGAIWVATSDRFRAHLELWNDCAFRNNASPVGADICASDPQHVDDSSIQCDDSTVFWNGNMTNSPASICHDGQYDYSKPS